MHAKTVSAKMKPANKSLMLNGMGFATGDPSIKISAPFILHPGTRVTVTEPGNAKWIYILLPLCKGDLITGTSVVYNKSDINTKIAQVRMVEQESPASATVVYSQKTNCEETGVLTLTGSCKVEVKTSVLLNLCLDFASTASMIELGAIEIHYIPEFALPEVKNESSFLSLSKTRKIGKLKRLQTKLPEFLFFKT